ncbi:hypothetical protein Fmac_028924 [Flemingia macrophylla]|uniref:Uncharacterized protein n=1 Tax=Flemingia macrophylla TaxID=520843 RepID=A0ABD1LAC7_9FABA
MATKTLDDTKPPFHDTKLHLDSKILEKEASTRATKSATMEVLYLSIPQRPPKCPQARTSCHD